MTTTEAKVDAQVAKPDKPVDEQAAGSDQGPDRPTGRPGPAEALEHVRCTCCETRSATPSAGLGRHRACDQADL